MTASVVAAVPAPELRPVAWRRLAWVAWRRQRTMILSTAAVLCALGAYLVITGIQMRSAWHVVQACTPQQSSTCNFAWGNFKDQYSPSGIISAVFVFAPLLIGVFAGAPQIGREFETGTFRYAWTQGVSRTRWAVAMIVSGAVAVAVLTGVFGALVAWHDQPLVQGDFVPRLQPDVFPTTGVAIIGWGLAAYALGVLGRLILRRVLPALVAALVVIFALDFVASKLRLHYLPARTTTSLDYIPGSQTIDQWWERGGAVVTNAQLNARLQAAGVGQIQVSNGKTSETAHPGQGTDPVSYLLHHGYTQWTSYQPAGRYWTFQRIEFAWLGLVAVLVLAACVLLLRRSDA